MTSEYKHIWSTKSKVRTYKILIPKSKNKKLDEYIRSHDSITKETLQSFGINKFNQVLAGCARRCKCEIIPISGTEWKITK